MCTCACVCAYMPVSQSLPQSLRVNGGWCGVRSKWSWRDRERSLMTECPPSELRYQCTEKHSRYYCKLCYLLSWVVQQIIHPHTLSKYIHTICPVFMGSMNFVILEKILVNTFHNHSTSKCLFRPVTMLFTLLSCVVVLAPSQCTGFDSGVPGQASVPP